MNVFTHFKNELMKISSKLYNLTEDAIAVELPKERSHGDLATNIAMVLKAKLGRQPREIAEEVAAEFRLNPDVEFVEVAGPGFLNFVLRAEFWIGALKNILSQGTEFGRSNIGAGKNVNVEYVSANPTGPMHVGHMRQAAFGDALASLLDKAGFNVYREYYINDAGNQIDILARTAYQRYLQALELEWNISEGMYPGEYLIPVGEALKAKYQDSLLQLPEDERLKLIKPICTEQMLELIKADLHSFGVKHDLFFSERTMHEKEEVKKTLDYLEKQGLIYRGILEAPKGKTPEDYEAKEQTIFKATEYGDDVDRPVVKSDGNFTYFAADISYHKNKLDRGFNDMVLVLGADHSGYIKRMKAVVKALSAGHADIDIKIVQMVSLVKGGEPVKMSKRSGSFVTLSDVVEEVGKDVARFVMLTRKNDSPITFDYDKVVEQSKDNPVFYVQYASARINSVLKLAKERGFAPDDSHLSRLGGSKDLEIIRYLCEFPKVVESAALAHEPHRITYYVIELANIFHSLWSYGNSHEEYRFIIDNEPELTSARLSLAFGVQTVIKSALAILGVEALEKM